ncbi:hypothetical protein IF188_14525 [Microbacterium sp. NEAU-LLC]|uniref:Uncharacterized protein n=1 Tax=Microbacterium helvum TaxID=2773713 RepID=A0ABR8NR00_9MICO|nr:hypothetical protein [Microbacterium helvum]MBD3942908.1 hypothetical protein [Microbacterium helvum]
MNDIDIDERRLSMGRRGDGLTTSLAKTAGDAALIAFGGEQVRDVAASAPLTVSSLVVAIDRGKGMNRVRVADGEGLVA